VFVAAVAATFAYRSSRAGRDSADAAAKQLERLLESDERDRALSRSEQARQIAIWYERPVGYDDYFTIWFSNASSLPVYETEIEIALQDPGTRMGSFAVTHLSPRSTFTSDAVNQSLADKRRELPHFVAHGFQPSAICLSFSDANGVRWKRDLGGKLAEIREVRDGETYREELLDPHTSELLPDDYYSVSRKI
jgi:hypothetical protein